MIFIIFIFLSTTKKRIEREIFQFINKKLWNLKSFYEHSGFKLKNLAIAFFKIKLIIKLKALAWKEMQDVLIVRVKFKTSLPKQQLKKLA